MTILPRNLIQGKPQQVVALAALWILGLTGGLVIGEILTHQDYTDLSLLQLPGFKFSHIFNFNPAINSCFLLILATINGWFFSRSGVLNVTCSMKIIAIGILVGIMPGMISSVELSTVDWVKKGKIQSIVCDPKPGPSFCLYSEIPGENFLEEYIKKTAPGVLDFKTNNPWIALFHDSKPMGLFHHHLTGVCKETTLTEITLPEDLLFSQHVSGTLALLGINGDSLIRSALQSNLLTTIYETKAEIIEILYDEIREIVNPLLANPSVTLVSERFPCGSIHNKFDIIYMNSLDLIEVKSNQNQQMFDNHFKLFFDRLSTNGVLAINVYKDNSCDNYLQLSAMIWSMLATRGFQEPEKQIFALSSQNRVLLLVGKEEFSMKTVAEFAWLIRISPEYEALWAPGMRESTDISEIFLTLKHNGTIENLSDSLSNVSRYNHRKISDSFLLSYLPILAIEFGGSNDWIALISLIAVNIILLFLFL